VPDEPVPDDDAGMRAANARLKAVVRAKETQIGILLSMDSMDSGTPSSREHIGAKEARRARQRSERERRNDRTPGGQPGHPGERPLPGSGSG
jgi:hypothetical protein